MTPAEKAYYDYKESVDKGYSGGLIPEITDYVDELREERDTVARFNKGLADEIQEKDRIIARQERQIIRLKKIIKYMVNYEKEEILQNQ